MTADEVRSALPGLFRVAVTSGWRLLSWSVTTSVDTTTGVLKAMVAGEPPTVVIRLATEPLRSLVGQTLGTAPSTPAEVGPPEHRPRQRATTEELRARGAELLYHSADVRFAEDMHPAYERILEEIAPDEARILRFLATEGSQPAVDVRTSRPLGVGSELIASGLSMIGVQSGVRNLERTNAYLNNLYRLGLVWFSREQLDPSRYQVVEVQPEVTDAMKKAGRAPKTVRRSIHLTPFGGDFCATCLPLNGNRPQPPALPA